MKPISSSGAARVGILDELRGLSILLMVIYHGAYDLVAIFGWDIPIFYHPVFNVLQPFFAGVFIFISGIACRYSHNNLKRGVIALWIGFGMTLVTVLFLPSQAILFGILHMLGSAMVLFALLQKGLDKIPTPVGISIFSVLFLLSYHLPHRYISFMGLFRFDLPSELYSTSFLFPVGLPNAGFFSSDYFPLIPWLFLFFVGAYVGNYFKKGKMPKAFYASHVPALAAVGRHTLLIYVLHQPILYGFFSLISWLTNR